MKIPRGETSDCVAVCLQLLDERELLALQSAERSVLPIIGDSYTRLYIRRRFVNRARVEGAKQGRASCPRSYTFDSQSIITRGAVL